MESVTGSGRIAYIDVAKGLGILLVVLGHNYIKATLPWVGILVYSFHMPFFFMLSGMLFKPGYGWGELIRRRFRSLLLPYLVTIFLIYFVYLFYTETPLSVIGGRLLKSAYASGNYIEWAQLWFLPHLFALNLFGAFLYKSFYGRIKPLWIRILVLAGILWLGVRFLPTFAMRELSLFGRDFVLDGLPFSSDLLLVTGPFFLLGYEIRRNVPQSFFASRWALALSGLALAGLALGFPYRMDLFFREYSSYPVVTLEVLCGSVFVFAMASWIASRQDRIFYSLKYAGNLSIILLIFHQPVQRLTYEKTMTVIVNPYAASILSFIVAVSVPVLIYELILRGKPRLSWLFGVSNQVEKPGSNIEGRASEVAEEGRL